MTDFYLILAGFGIGLTLAAPGGPVNILCIQRTLRHGFWAGVAVGLGAVLGDGLLALLAASGMTFVTEFLSTFASEVQVIGGMILLLFGLKLSHDRLGPSASSEIFDKLGARPYPPEPQLRLHLPMVPQSFLLTVSNPGAILGTFALIGGLASVFGAELKSMDIAMVVGAVVLGNLTWWLALSHTINRFRDRISTQRLQIMNRYAGLALMGFGVLLLLRGGFSLVPPPLATFASTVIEAFVVA